MNEHMDFTDEFSAFEGYLNAFWVYKPGPGGFKPGLVDVPDDEAIELCKGVGRFLRERDQDGLFYWFQPNGLETCECSRVDDFGEHLLAAGKAFPDYVLCFHVSAGSDDDYSETDEEYYIYVHGDNVEVTSFTKVYQAANPKNLGLKGNTMEWYTANGRLLAMVAEYLMHGHDSEVTILDRTEDVDKRSKIVHWAMRSLNAYSRRSRFDLALTAPIGCECDNTHQQNKTVCQVCWDAGLRFETAWWNKPDFIIAELWTALSWLVDDMSDAGEARNPQTGELYDSVANAKKVLKSTELYR